MLGRCVARAAASSVSAAVRRSTIHVATMSTVTTEAQTSSSTTSIAADTARSNRLVWVDCEMTGLDPQKQTLVEIAAIITDQDLNIIAEGPDIVINQSDDVLKEMDPWCQKTFKKNGLLEKIRESKVSLEEAENQVLTFLESETDNGKCPLAGNTVYMDRLFLRKYMPRVDAHLHYRIVDVTSIKELGRQMKRLVPSLNNSLWRVNQNNTQYRKKWRIRELCRRWYPAKLDEAPKKKMTHRALDDIRESIDELKFYRSAIFKDLPVASE